MLEFDPIVTTSAARQIAEHIRSAILDGRLKADERLPTETDLAKQYGVSRPTVREALKRLAAQNLVRSRRGPSGGNFVTCPQPQEIAESLAGAAVLMVSMGSIGQDEISSARRALEGACCRLAARNRTDTHLDNMDREIALQAAAGTTDEDFCASDVRFHRAIVDAAGNSLVSLVMYGVIEAMAPLTNMITYRVRNRQQIVQRHRALRNAIGQCNPDSAEAELSGLIDDLQTFYVKALAQRTARQAGRERRPDPIPRERSE